MPNPIGSHKIPMAQEGRVGDPAAEVEDTHLSIEMGIDSAVA